MKIKFPLPLLLLLLLAACTPQIPTPEPTLTPTLTLAVPSPTPTTPAPSPAPLLSSEQGLFVQDGQANLPGARLVIWSNDGLTLSLLAQNSLQILDSSSLEVIHTFSDPDLDYILDFAADGRTLAVANADKGIDLIDAYSGERRSLQPGVPFISASFSPEGSLLVLASIDEWAAHIWDVASGGERLVLTGFETAAPVYQVRFAANVVEMLWIARGTVQVQNIATRQLYPPLGHEDFVTALAMANNEPLLVTAAGGTIDGEFSPLLYVWNAHTAEEYIRIRTDQLAYSLHFSPDDRFLAAGEGPDVILYTAADMLEADRLPGSTAGVVDVRFSPDAARLAVLDGDGRLQIWRLASD